MGDVVADEEALERIGGLRSRLDSGAVVSDCPEEDSGVVVVDD